MPPQLDLLVAILELVAFFLVTPEVLGPRRLEAAYHQMGRLQSWLREVWFDPAFGPIPPLSVMLLVLAASSGAAVLLGSDLAQGISLVGTSMAVAVAAPVAFRLLYRLLQKLYQRERLGRVLAIIGAFLFVTGRAIVIASAYSRLPG